MFATQRFSLARWATLAACVFTLVALSPATLAAVQIGSIWGRSGTLDLFVNGGPTNLTGWQLRSSDTDELAQSTSTSGFNSLGDIFGLSIVLNGFQGFGFPYIDATTLGGSVITTAPHDLDAGSWAYAFSLVDPSNVPRAFVQLRLAGSTATVLDSSLATAAVNAGVWSGVNDYIEFDPGFAYYVANDATPYSPSDFSGFVFPEPSTALLSLFACMAVGGLSRRVPLVCQYSS